MPRNTRSEYARRNARAKAKGWTSYGQQRYWAENDTARKLARKACPHPDSHPFHDGDRSTAALLCGPVNSLVNPYGGGRSGRWQDRLKDAARKGR